MTRRNPSAIHCSKRSRPTPRWDYQTQLWIPSLAGHYARRDSCNAALKNKKRVNKDNKITVPFHEFNVKMQEIGLEGGFVHRIEVKPTHYVLFITWDENAAGDAHGNEPQASPVQHDSSETTEEQLP